MNQINDIHFLWILGKNYNEFCFMKKWFQIEKINLNDTLNKSPYSIAQNLVTMEPSENPNLPSPNYKLEQPILNKPKIGPHDEIDTSLATLR